MPHFCESTYDRCGHEKQVLFSPGGHPPSITPNMTANTGFIRILAHLGDLFEKGRTPGEK